jgi:hypothetical protein
VGLVLAKPSAALATVGILLLSFSPLLTANASHYYVSGQHLAFGNSHYLIMGSSLTFAVDCVSYGNGTVNIGSTWLNSSVDMTLTSFLTNNWLNYTVSSVGTQMISNGTKPAHIWLDGYLATEGTGWTYDNDTTTTSITAAGSSAWLRWEAASPPVASSTKPLDIRPPRWIPEIPLIPQIVPSAPKTGNIYRTVAIAIVFIACALFILIIMIRR